MSGTARSKSLILFASGKGSNVKAIIEHFNKNGHTKVNLIVCNRPDAGVLDIARDHNIPFLLITKESFGATLLTEQLKAYHPDLIVLCGFLWKIPQSLLEAFPGKIINIHPALLPKYGGKGMYGNRVHEAVLAAGEKETGITIHFVNEHYDEGGHILQAHCKVQATDSTEGLAARISRLEHSFFPRTIEYLLNEQ